MIYYKQPSFNINIEEEYQFIDPSSRDILGFATSEGLAMSQGEQSMPTKWMSRNQVLIEERHSGLGFAQRMAQESMEVGTGVCGDVKDARRALTRVRQAMLESVNSHGMKLMAAGTHPFSQWERTESGRHGYSALMEEMQMSTRLLAFGMYVHVDVEDGDLAIDVMNAMRYLLPHILCLANSSPLWRGQDTGLSSYRSVLLEDLPRTGIPNAFRSYNDYESYVDTLIRTNCIPDPGHIWWDIRPYGRSRGLFSPGGKGSIEIRICDVLPDIDDVIAVTALLQAVAAWMVDLRYRNMSFRVYDRSLIAENKWRAVRYGLRGKLLDFGIEEEVPISTLIQELLERVEPIVDHLNSREEIEHINTMLERGTSSDQQRRKWQDSGADGEAVVDFLVAQTEGTV